MNVRNWIGVVLAVLCLGLLFPGLTQEMLTISASIKFLAFEKEIMRESRSILSTVEQLWKNGDVWIAFIIFLFSVLIPFLKIILVAVATIRRESGLGQKVLDFVKLIGKWSMADVFVVAIFVAYMSGNANSNLQAKLEPGFYWFLGYCLCSLVSLQFMKFVYKKN